MRHPTGDDDRAEAISLPSPSALLCAMAGQHLEGPLCVLAYQLVEIHRRRLIRPDSDENLLALRIPVLARIDALTPKSPAPSPAGRPYEQGLALLVDQLTWAAAQAFDLLLRDDIGGERVHRAWTRLAELELEYADLYRDLQEGRRYLPTGIVHAEISGDLVSEIMRSLSSPGLVDPPTPVLRTAVSGPHRGPGSAADDSDTSSVVQQTPGG
ncbi:hypothetical protein [Nocardia flavorosea]|uniref:Uncharacterized protein n=1 Tax=Nocardia flavorosea TaxID=53429 RepID=A0A846Y601_9NOCA|nr:hypothetical protein [Nocardia flavorosea]NKY54976.1 hypothetical protein [Nocardia flavorosea]